MRARLLPWIRSFWRVLMVIMVFAQAALAAESCRDCAGCGHGAAQEIAEVLDCHHGGVLAACASEFTPVDQRSIADPAVAVPALGPGPEVAAFRPAAPFLQALQASPDPGPVASVPLFLILRRLLR
jgi:hypothetical protein